MKTKIGAVLILLGTGLVATALVLYLRNAQEQTRAAQTVAELMPQLVDVILDNKQEAVTAQSQSQSQSQPQPVEQHREMTKVQIDGHDYIGFLGIPALELELPVMADWSYPKLQIAPCLFSGSIFTGDIVIMAHNYEKHFGGLSKLHSGDIVSFTDGDGMTLYYEVVALDVLLPDAVEEMTSGEYDLTLFTCTYGGKSRVTVRCDRTEAPAQMP